MALKVSLHMHVVRLHNTAQIQVRQLPLQTMPHKPLLQLPGKLHERLAQR
jgi:hypothetical protein